MDESGAIAINGEMVISEIDILYTGIEELIEKASRNIVLDLSKVDEIDASGLQLLFALHKTIRETGTMNIRAVSTRVKEILALSGFDILLKEAL